MSGPVSVFGPVLRSKRFHLLLIWFQSDVFGLQNLSVRPICLRNRTSVQNPEQTFLFHLGFLALLRWNQNQNAVLLGTCTAQHPFHQNHHSTWNRVCRMFGSEYEIFRTFWVSPSNRWPPCLPLTNQSPGGRKTRPLDGSGETGPEGSAQRASRTGAFRPRLTGNRLVKMDVWV